MQPDATRHTLLARLGNAEDGRAWREFELQYRDLVVRYCLRRGLQESDAEDIYQIVLLSLSTLFRRGFRQQRDRGRFRAYLGRVTHNAVARWCENPGRGVQRLSTEVSLQLGDERPAPSDEVWEEEWRQHHFRRALRQARSGFEASSMRIFDALLEGRSIGEVAQQSGISEQGVYKVRSRVRARMEELVQAQVREEDGV